MMKDKQTSTEDYRPNVCGVLVNQTLDSVLMFRRTDVTTPAQWQFPQGGIDEGESAQQAILREIKEEIGVSAVSMLAMLCSPIRYTYPPDVKQRMIERDIWGKGFAGQEQSWFMLQFHGVPTDFYFGHSMEFDDWCWTSPQEAVDNVVNFKQSAYRQALAAFGLFR